MQSSGEKLKIRPPLTSGSNQEVAALKAQLTVELKNKKQCAYHSYECTQLTLDGYRYCARHILHDRAAPFRQCSFVYNVNGKRCPLPAYKTERKDSTGSYCMEHSIKATLSRYRHAAKVQPQPSPEVSLSALTQYLKKPRQRSLSSINGLDRVLGRDHSEDAHFFTTVDPMRDIDAIKVANNTSKEILDFCSESDSDVDATCFNSVWNDAHVDSSDNESIDSEQEDVLKHANIYTAEEITQITRDKLIKLQSLYIEQYRHLQHILKEKRRKYLHSLKREKETCSTIHNQAKDTPKEQRQYRKLNALKRYHYTYGSEAILNKRLYDSRLKLTEGIPNKPFSYSKCTYIEGGVKCGERSLPLAKHCRKHILEDTNQVLFRACGKVNADVECSTSVEVVFEEATCRLHMDLPVLKSYSQVRKNSESDFDDSLEHKDNVIFTDVPPPANVDSLPIRDTEFMDWKMDSTLPSNLFETKSTTEDVNNVEEAADHTEEPISATDGNCAEDNIVGNVVATDAPTISKSTAENCDTVEKTNCSGGNDSSTVSSPE